MQTQLVVSGPSDLRALAAKISLWRNDRRSLVVRLGTLDEHANADLTRRVSGHYGACGCHQGRVAGMATMAVYLGLVLTGVISLQALGLGRVVLLYFLVSFVVMFIGKLVGLRNARKALHRLADELETASATHVLQGVSSHG